MAPSTKFLKKYKRSIEDDYSIVNEANHGVDSDIFFEIAELSGISKSYLAEEIFDMSLKTMLRYRKENKKLNARDSEVALKIVSVMEKGLEVFGAMAAFKTWMEKPAYGMGNKRPLAFMNTITGMDLIEEELLRIEYGALA